MSHIPVLLKEIIEVLDPKPKETFADCTLGGAGHARQIVKRISPGGRFLGLDWSVYSASNAGQLLRDFIKEENLEVELKVLSSNFANLKQILDRINFPKLDGLILDLGFSSLQLKGFGFSFAEDEPLVMRYDGDLKGLTAARVVNEFDEKTLARIFSEFGEERLAKRIAHDIAKARREKPIRRTKELAEIVKKSKPAKSKIHPATKIFMALRIFVNQELKNLEQVLADIPFIMAKGGRVAIISFNSLEDRLVKNCFRNLKQEGYGELISKKPITPSKEEIGNNPRSRSAKLRAIKFIS